ncbi:glycosyltransferase family 2 protein [Desulfosediminicola flagellatus]|uniref:glycosyltransferase family 2 protein n=1 Tax=Desulfosediminicola flagellatus TaxID=2569541 RepID=UPI0010AD4D5F|nr:glycosyltransferase family 2 protein [Desulfosediminicola flagellatus]
MSTPPIILLGIITCKRPNLLTELLESIIVQSIFSTPVKVETVIIDNDDEQSGRPVFNEFVEKFPCKLEYLSEIQRGIPYARNRVIDAAIASDAQYIVFIDDDETAAPDWLLALHTIITTNNVDAVQGQVISLLPEKNTPRWATMAKRKAWNKKEGQPRKGMSTNNVIFSSSLVTDKGLRFDERFALSGGSDIDFFNRSAETGSKHIWTNTATVYEKIPHTRLTVQWQFQRLFRVGAATTHMSVQQKGYAYTLMRYFPKIVSRLILGPLLLISVGIVSSKAFLTSIHWTGSAIGLVLGFFGILGKEYQTIHGN